MRIAVACASGSIKGVFVHGALRALEEAGFAAEAYAGASSSALPAAFAAMRRVGALRGTEYWAEIGELYSASGGDIGRAIKAVLRKAIPALEAGLFADGARRFAVAASEVVTEDAAALTQGEGARRLGQRLVIATKRRDRSWAEANLRLRVFDTRSESPEYRLGPGNLEEALYATTRMLHAWKDPAWIGGRPFVDASYTCMCPAVELAERGMDRVVAISPEAGPLRRDFFGAELLPAAVGGIPILHVQPERDLAELGVDYLKATARGLREAFELGERAGSAALRALRG